MTKKNLSEIERGAGLFTGFITGIMDVMRERSLLFEALYRLVTQKSRETLGKLVDIIAADYAATCQCKLGQFRVPVSFKEAIYAQFVREFNGVNPDFQKASFTVIERCRGVEDGEDREVTFEYLHLDRNVTTENALVAMDTLGYRPATFVELLAFARWFPEEQLKFPIVALGSEALIGRYRHIATIDKGDVGRHLFLSWAGRGWGARFRFLVVRKGKKGP